MVRKFQCKRNDHNTSIGRTKQAENTKKKYTYQIHLLLELK